MPRIVFGEQHGPDGQPTMEWMKLRCGRITASRLGDVMAYSKQKSKEGIPLKARSDYAIELLSERLTGLSSNHFVTNEMKWGAEQEEYARSAYEQRCSLMVEPVCFAVHPALDFTGGSPDGLVGDDSGIEIKCLTTGRHLGIWKSREVPQEYADQIQWNMVCCEREKWDFVCFDSRLPAHLQLLVIPVAYDEKRVAELEAEVCKINAEVEQMIEELNV